MGDASRKEVDLAGVNRNVHDLPALDRLEDHLAFKLVEELGSLVDVVVLAAVRSADDHDDEFVVFEDLLVAHRRLEQAPVLVDPSLEVEGLRFHRARLAAASWRRACPGSICGVNPSDRNPDVVSSRAPRALGPY